MVMHTTASEIIDLLDMGVVPNVDAQPRAAHNAPMEAERNRRVG
jgi:hypothetical protein